MSDKIAIGDEAENLPNFTNSIAFGRGSVVIGDHAIAIGIGAQAVGDNAMAIGHGVIALTGEQKVEVEDWFSFLHECRGSLYKDADQDAPTA